MIFYTIIILLVIIFLSGGDFNNLSKLKFKKTYLIVIGAMIPIICNILTRKDFGILSQIVVSYFFYLHILGYIFQMAFLAFNLKFKFIKLILIGFFLNLIVIIANSKMPVSKSVVYKFENEHLREVLLSGRSLTHGVFESPKFFILSDIFHINFLNLKNTAFSIGDILISVGFILCILSIVKVKNGELS